MDPKLGQLLRRLNDENAQLRAAVNQLMTDVKKLQIGNHDPRAEINAIDGRRVAYFLAANQSFTATQDGQRGADMPMTISQDGPFIWTHMPIVMWRVNAPSTATNFGFWSTIYSWPLPTQDTANNDAIDLSWEIRDGGSQRLLQNESLPPMLSYPGALHPLPEWTMFSPNTTAIFTPIYENIAFNGSAATPATGGLLKVMLPGFRIVSM